MLKMMMKVTIAIYIPVDDNANKLQQKNKKEQKEEDEAERLSCQRSSCNGE